MRASRWLTLLPLLVVALASSGCDGTEEEGGECSSYFAPAVVGSCVAADGYCIEFRGTITPADAEAICVQTSRPWSTSACPAASKAFPGCALTVDGNPRIIYSATHTREKCEGDGANCFVEAGSSN